MVHARGIDGIRSLGHWLTLRCAFTRAEADRRASLVDRRKELPCLYEAFDDGKLSVGFMQSAQRVADPATDAKITQVATTATHPQAARTFAAYRDVAEARDGRAHEPEGNEANPAEQASSPGADDPEGYDPTDPRLWLHTWWDDHAHLRVDARLDATDGATLRALLDQIRWLDRFAITVTIDAEVLAGLRSGSGILADGSTVPVEQVCRWIEAATLEPLLLEGGKPLFMGRNVRIATPAQRRALRVRDGGCGYPGCGRHDHLHAHHIVEWTDGGLTDVDAMVLLCGRHHRLLHRGEYTITMQDGLPRFDSPALGEDRNRPPPRPLDVPDGERPTWRCCEPLTYYGLDVLVGSLLTARYRESTPDTSSEREGDLTPLLSG